MYLISEGLLVADSSYRQCWETGKFYGRFLSTSGTSDSVTAYSS